MIIRLLALMVGLFACAVGCNTRGAAPDVAVNGAGASATGATGGPALPAASAVAKSNTPPQEDGPTLYKRYCALCHGAEAQGYAADNAPSLTTVSFLESADDEYIANAIRVGRPGTAMAGYIKRRGGPLTDRDVREVVRFIRSKGPKVKALATSTSDGDSTHGEAVYQAQCVACHGTEHARGNAVWLFNSELLRSATPEFLRHAIVYGRPPTPMQAYGEKLPAADVDDLVAFLRSKKPLAPGEVAPVDLEALRKLPTVINPKGKTPAFKLRANRFVSVDQVVAALRKKNRMVIVDARSPSDFIRSHIPGAISNGYYDRSGLDRLQNDGTWVIAYCACPHHASGEVVDELRRRGFKHTAVLDEGILEWQHRGYPVEGRETTPPPAPPSAQTAASFAPPMPGQRSSAPSAPSLPPQSRPGGP